MNRYGSRLAVLWWTMVGSARFWTVLFAPLTVLALGGETSAADRTDDGESPQSVKQPEVVKVGTHGAGEPVAAADHRETGDKTATAKPIPVYGEDDEAPGYEMAPYDDRYDAPQGGGSQYNDGHPHGHGYGGPRRNDGYGAPRRNDGYGAPRRNDGYGAPRRNDGYGAPRRNDGYGAPRRNDGYGAPRRDDGYGGPRRDDGYGGPRRNDGYGAPRRDDGYGAPRRDDGYGARPDYRPRSWHSQGADRVSRTDRVTMMGLAFQEGFGLAGPTSRSPMPLRSGRVMMSTGYFFPVDEIHAIPLELRFGIADRFDISLASMASVSVADALSFGLRLPMLAAKGLVVDSHMVRFSLLAEAWLPQYSLSYNSGLDGGASFSQRYRFGGSAAFSLTNQTEVFGNVLLSFDQLMDGGEFANNALVSIGVSHTLLTGRTIGFAEYWWMGKADQPIETNSYGMKLGVAQRLFHEDRAAGKDVTGIYLSGVANYDSVDSESAASLSINISFHR